MTGVAPSVDDLVWTSLEPFERRAERVATSWAAIGRLLEVDRPLGGAEDEYLGLHGWLRSVEPEIFTALVRTPQAYAWVRRTQEALSAGLGRSADRVPVAQHRSLASRLADAKLLFLGAAVAGDQPLRFECPHEVQPPVVLPLGDALLVGDVPIRIMGAGGGDVLIDDAGTTRPADVVREPSLPAEHGSIRLSPFVLQTSDIESLDRSTVLEYGLRGHRQALPLMEESFALLARYAPEAHRQIGATVDTIALHDPGRADGSQASLSDLPGTFAVPCSPNPYVNVECIVHEYFHNRLFALEELGRVFEDETEEAGGGPVVYSPWRVETRPLKGLLHSTYVFAPVAEFWLGVWRAGRADPVQLAYALDDTVRHRLQLAMGVELLRRRARLTPWGQDILDALERRVRAFDAACREAGVPHDTEAMATRLDGTVEPLRWVGRDTVSVRENIRANIEGHDVNGDTRELTFSV